MAVQGNVKLKNTKKRFSLLSYFREIKAEIKRITWPTKKELLKNTGVVLTVVYSYIILVWGLDYWIYQGAL